jgi:hypothetical protein
VVAADLADARYVGMLENIYSYKGRCGHEVVLVYEDRISDTGFYENEKIQGDESGQPFKAVLKRLDEFGPGNLAVYPDELLKLLWGFKEISRCFGGRFVFRRSPICYSNC